MNDLFYSDDFEELWMYIPNSDVLCSEDDNSFEVRIDRSVKDTDCNYLCNYVGLQCLDGFADINNIRCPTAGEISYIGCEAAQFTFVCSCKKRKLPLYTVSCLSSDTKTF